MPNNPSDNPDQKTLSEDARSIVEILRNAQASLTKISHSPHLDADILLAHVLECERSTLKAWPERVVSEAHQAQFFKLIDERATGTPIAYLLGKKAFWTFEVDVNEHTLVPRPETELLVEQALKLMPEDGHLKVADVCTGSGAIAFALASERTNIQVHASDIDNDALDVARSTLTRLNLNNVDFFEGDLYKALPDQDYDLIVSNPPYIDKNDPYLQHPTMHHEPRHALIAEDKGMAIIEQLMAEVKNYLKKDGYLLLEHGHEQADDIRHLAKAHSLHYQLCLQDFQALDRISVLQYL